MIHLIICVECWLFGWLLACTDVQAAKILGLFPHASESNFAVMREIMTELAQRQHNVTIYSSHRLNEPIDNLQEILIEPAFSFWTNLEKHAAVIGGPAGLSELSNEKLQYSLASVGAAGVDYFLSQQPLQILLQLNADHFDYDLIILDLFYTEALLAIGYVFNKPTIGIINTNFGDYMNAVQENLVPVACSSIEFNTNKFINYMGYWQRLFNLRTCMTRRNQFVGEHYAAQEQLIKKYFKISNTVQDMQAHLAILLLNNYAPLLTPRPLLQNIIPAGGLHIRSPHELPWHIKRFLDESRAGVVYMHLGNQLLCAKLPTHLLNTFFAVLGKRKERVLWTCHDAEKLNNLPKNFMIQHAVPQTDILAHPHVRVFLMNGDLLGLQEGIVRHVPMLGIPIFRNEIDNMALAVRLGVGLQLDYKNVSEITLTWCLNALMSNTTYPLQIRKVSAAFRDRPLGALATSMFWINYVLRHNGGAQLKTPGIGISLQQLHLFDLFVFYFVATIAFVTLLVGALFIAKYIWHKEQAENMYFKLRKNI